MCSRKMLACKNRSQGRTAVVQHGALLRRAVKWIVTKDSFANMRLHGNTKWVPQNLVMLAVLFSWSDSQRMTDGFDKAAKLSQELFGVLAIGTFQGMVRALATYGPQLMPCLWARLQSLMEQAVPEHFRIR